MSQWPIAELIPHAGDMILIDQVLRFGDEDIETQLTIRNGGLFNLDDGSLPAWVGIELMAQSVAAYAGCQARLRGEPVELGFLLGTRKYECNVERFPAGSRADYPWPAARWRMTTAWACSNASCAVPASRPARGLNVFRPPQVASYLQEEFQETQP